MRAPSASCSWWQRTVFFDTALYSFTGTFTSPKLIEPLQIDLGMVPFYPAKNKCCVYPPLSKTTGRARQKTCALSIGYLLRLLKYDISRVFVVAQALECGLAERARPGPAAELDLPDKARLDENRPLRRLAPREGALAGSKRLEALQEVLERALGEARPDVAGVEEFLVRGPRGIVITDRERADRRAPCALAGEPAAAHELLSHLVLDLEPGAAPAPGLIAAVEPLRDDALEPLFLARVEHRLPVADVV